MKGSLLFAGVGVSSTDVLGLQVLELAVQVGAVLFFVGEKGFNKGFDLVSDAFISMTSWQVRFSLLAL